MMHMPANLCHIILILLLLTGVPSDLYADSAGPRPWPAEAGLTPCGSGYAEAVTGAGHLRLDDGSTVRLADIKLPELWPEGGPGTTWPGAENAHERLTALSRDSLNFFCFDGDRRHDRHGRRLAHISTATGLWLQQTLLTQGMALLSPAPGSCPLLGDLYMAEDTARRIGRGLWRLQAYRARDANKPDSVPNGHFIVLSGQVADVSVRRGWVYVNFGDNWRSDVTLDIPAGVARSWRKQGFDPVNLKGRHIEARGWSDWRWGPRVLVRAMGQIRLAAIAEGPYPAESPAAAGSGIRRTSAVFSLPRACASS